MHSKFSCTAKVEVELGPQIRERSARSQEAQTREKASIVEFNIRRTYIL